MAVPYFETSLSPANPSYLVDHQIYQQTIVPSTAYLEMGLAAGKHILKQTQLHLSHVSIQHPLSLTAAQATPVQIVLQVPGVADSSSSSAEEAAYSFEVFRVESGSRADSTWTRHAAGRVARLPADEVAPAAIDLESLKQAHPEAIDVAGYYQHLWQRGMAYGPSFQGIQTLLKGADGVLGRVELPPAAGAAGGYSLHPALLDACFQVLGALVNEGQTDAYLPVIIEAINLYAPVPRRVWSQVRMRPQAGLKRGQLCADLMLWNDSGEAIATLQGLTLKQVSQRVLQRLLQPNFDDWLYRLDWQPLPTAVATAGQKRWLILGEPTGSTETALVNRLTQDGDQCTLVRLGGVYRQNGADYELDPADPEHFHQLIAAISAGVRTLPYDGIIHLPGAISATPLDAQSIMTSQRLACGSLLHLVQAVVQSRPIKFPRLWIITRATQAIANGTSAQPQFGSLWGMARVLSHEHPDLNCTCLDLAASGAGCQQETAWLAAEIKAEETHLQLAYREQQRYAARLVRYHSAPLTVASGLSVPDYPYQMRIRDYGVLENLQLRPMERSAPAPTEVEIGVRAVGLNFRDVLNALGMLKEFTEQMGIIDSSELPFGGECAGVVTAVGDQVSHVQVGDAVIAAQAMGSLASHVIVPAAFVMPKPAALSFEAAATIPIAFLTAYYGLQHLAQLQAGERVLIHAASGGVGQAAVQIAKSLGAEVWGSASQTKWATLQSQGLTQVFNSRTLDFADQIPALTDNGVDVVLNSLNGDFIPKTLSVLGNKGRFVEIGKIGIWNPEQVAKVRPDVSYLPFDLLDLSLDTPALITTLLRQVIERFEDGRLVPLPLKIFPIEQGIDAFRHMAQAKHIGKVVISMGALQRETDKPDNTAKKSASSLSRGSIKAEATYLITGGLGALGLQVAQWLAQQGAKQLVLTGRRSPSETAQTTI